MNFQTLLREHIPTKFLKRSKKKTLITHIQSLPTYLCSCKLDEGEPTWASLLIVFPVPHVPTTDNLPALHKELQQHFSVVMRVSESIGNIQTLKKIVKGKSSKGQKGMGNENEEENKTRPTQKSRGPCSRQRRFCCFETVGPCPAVKTRFLTY